MFDASSNQQTLLVGGTWALFHITVIFGFESPGWAVNCRHLLTSRTDLFFRRISLIGSIYIYIHCWNCFIYSTNYVMWILCPGAHLDSWFWIRRKSSGLGELWQVFLFVSSPQKNRGFTAKSLALAIVTQIFKIRNKLLNLMLLYYINKLMLVLLIHNTHRLKHLGNSNGLSSKKGFCHDLPPSPAGAVATAYLWMDEERKSQ
jgi:hypothetical protein